MQNKVRKVLEFYANIDNYRTLIARTSYGKEGKTKLSTGYPRVIEDKGQKARSILNEIR